jgi:hypothetical protein
MNWYQLITATKKPQVSADEAKLIGERIGIRWDQVAFDVDQFRRGIEVESEHGPSGPAGPAAAVVGSNEDFGKIAWAHLTEIPDYYTRLARMEAAAGG